MLVFCTDSMYKHKVFMVNSVFPDCFYFIYLEYNNEKKLNISETKLLGIKD